jgi:hypothetical protein
MSQCKSLSNEIADIQLNQSSSMINAGSGTALSKSVPSLRNFLHAGDSRVQELHERLFQNIGSFVKAVLRASMIMVWSIFPT